MFNLIVGARTTMSRQRVLEYTDEECRDYLVTGNDRGSIDLDRLQRLPTLLMPEIGDEDSPQVATLGSITRLGARGHADYRFEFTPNAAFAPLGIDVIEDLAEDLDVHAFEFRRTHWAVKRVDLYEALSAHLVAGRTPTPADQAGASDLRVFTPPTGGRDPHLVALMMPFGAHLDAVDEAIRGMATAAGWTCRRADDDEAWVNPTVTQDIFELIYRAQVVICDLTGGNTNVFYELGLADALGRHVILITQDGAGESFDVAHVRQITYTPDRAGRARLTTQLLARLRQLMEA